ncbi:uncharacterized protein [Diadema setosum]|uniref:uncharacterized protein n=1 Tax=Diadema setosum TaxID=31175 RepID=UPI003B3A39B6
MPRLSKFSLECPYLPDTFLSTAVTSSSSCQIQDLHLIFKSIQDDSQYHSSTGNDFAKWVLTMPRLSKFSLECPYLPDTFLSTAVTSSSSCQIQDLNLIVKGSNQDDSQYQSSTGKDFAKWVFTMPRLSKFSLKCEYLSHNFLSTAATYASSCLISELSLERSNTCYGFISESGATNLAEFLCRLPNLTRAELNLVVLPEIFFTTISSQASRCKVECITINGKPLRSFQSGNQLGIQTPSDDSSSEDDSSQETD